MEKFSFFLDKVGSRHGIERVFSDFLTFSVCALSAQTQEERYLKTAAVYKPNEMQLFANAFSALVLEMDNRGEGLKDCLGDYFQEFASSKKAGQFFTPEPICDLMARITQPKGLETVSDCACGSGRNLLAAAKINRYSVFYGADISLDCVNMTLINMCLNGLVGFVNWQNTLSMEIWGVWRVSLHPLFNIPYIEAVPAEQWKKAAPKIEERQPIEQKPILTPKFKRYEAASAQLDLF